jgi:predicted small integral membrane protein
VAVVRENVASERSDGLRSPRTLAAVSAVLTGTMALYIALVAFGNITDFGTNQQFVRHVLAMDTTFKDEDLMWRAIESTALQDAAYVAIIVWETLAALVLLAATALWGMSLRGDGSGSGSGIRRARRAGTVGLLMLMLLFGAGFIAIGGEWFSMWQSKSWNGLDAATRVFLLSGIVLVLTHLPSAERAGRDGPRAED